MADGREERRNQGTSGSGAARAHGDVASLSPDQRAILDLLVVRGQDYEAIGQVLGTDPDDARSRARRALARLGGADPDSAIELSDFLLGRADTITRADAIRHLRQDHEANELARRISAELERLFPDASLPSIPDPPGRRRTLAEPVRSSPADSTASEDEPPRANEPLHGRRQARMLAGIGFGALIVLVLTLAIAGAFSGGDDTGTQTAATDETGLEQGEEFVRVALETPSGGNASGDAIIGLATGDQPYLEMDVRDLSPAPNGETYIAWFMLGDDVGYPVAPIQVGQQGLAQDRYAIPGPFVPLLTRVEAVEIVLAADERVARTIERAIEENELVVDRVGRVIMRGEIPREAPPEIDEEVAEQLEQELEGLGEVPEGEELLPEPGE